MLSQGEIDSILGSLEEGLGLSPLNPNSNLRAKLYDFRRPDKFSKENLRALRMVHDTFSRSLSSSLSSYLRTGVQVHLSSVEQIGYDEYIQQLPHPTLVTIVNLSPLPGRVLVEINLNIAFVMLDRLLGGPGSGAPRIREITDIEYALFRRLIGHLLAGYRYAWGSIADLNPELDEIVLNPQFVQAALPGDMAVFVLCEVKVFNKSGTISICLPYTTLEPVMDRLSAQTWFASARRGSDATSEESRSGLRKQLRDVTVDLTVELGRTSLTVRDLVDLRAGDVVRLNSGVDDELTVCVEGRAKHRCRPGLLGHNLGVQITKTIVEGEVQPNVDQAKAASNR